MSDSLTAKGARLTRQLPDPDSIHAAQERELRLTQQAMTTYILGQMSPPDVITEPVISEEDEEEAKPLVVSPSVARVKSKLRKPKPHNA